jgi:hypothetical protein
MSLEADIKIGGLQRGRFRYFPVVPGRVEFAIALRRLLLAEKPQIVAVELPGFLEPAYLRALDRLPEMSVILCMSSSSSSSGDSDDDNDRPVYVPVEPADPFTEALRTAVEIGAQIIFLEPDTQDRPHLHDPCPDTYAVQKIGLQRYIEEYRVWPQQRTEEVTAHAAAMAWKLQGANPDLQTLVVVSLNLLDPLLDAMETPQDPPARRLLRPDTQLLNPHPESLAEITIEYPYLQERYEFFRLDLEGEAGLDKPKVQLDLLREAAGKYTESTGEKLVHWQRRMIARYTRNLAHISGDLVANAYDLAVAALGSLADGQPLPGPARSLQSGDRAPQRRRNLAEYQAPAHPASPAASQTAHAAPGDQAPQEGIHSRRMGSPDQWRRHLFLSAGGSGHRRLRPLPQEEGQGAALRRARARRAVHYVHPGRHRHPRDHPQLAPA